MFRVFESNPPQIMGITFVAVETRQLHGLIADNALHTITGSGIDAPQIGIRLGSGDKERGGFVKSEEALEVEVGAVHHVNRCGLRNQQIE